MGIHHTTKHFKTRPSIGGIYTEIHVEHSWRTLMEMIEILLHNHGEGLASAKIFCDITDWSTTAWTRCQVTVISSFCIDVVHGTSLSWAQ